MDSDTTTTRAAPGRVLTGERARYVLGAQIHDGPRSSVWLADRLALDGGRAREEEGGGGGGSAREPPPSPSPPPRHFPAPRRVAVKLVAPRRSRASHNEADVMRALSACAEATGPDGFAAPLLDAFELAPPPPPALASSPSARSSSSSNPPPPAPLALVTPLYGPTCAAVVRGLTAERGRGLPRRAVRRVARTLLRALAHLHGPRHRLAYLDLKPHNLVVEPSPRQGGQGNDGDGDDDDARGPARKTPPPKQERWRLIDFGNASPLVRAGPWPLSRAPASWPFLPAPFGWRAARLPEYASPAYEAPESVLRLEGMPAAPADVWALGCTLYECATGWPLFRPLLVRGRLAIDDEGEENDSDTGGDEDEGEGNEEGGGRRRWRRRVFSTAAEARLLSAVRATLGPAPMAVLRRSPVWRDYYDRRGEPLDDEGTGGPPSRAIARQPGSRGLRGRRLEDRLMASLGRRRDDAEWGPQRAAAFAAFLRSMLEFDPDKRATAEAMLRHEWLLSSDPGEEEGLDWEEQRAARPPPPPLPQLQIEELEDDDGP